MSLSDASNDAKPRHEVRLTILLTWTQYVSLTLQEGTTTRLITRIVIFAPYASLADKCLRPTLIIWNIQLNL